MLAQRFALPSVLALVAAGLLSVQSYAPPPVLMPDEATLKKIEEKTEELDKVLQQLRQGTIPDALIADVAIFHKAAVWIVKHKEWYHKDYSQWTLDALETGLERARQLRLGQSPWLTQTGRVLRGYRSAVDHSIQPYGVVLPKAFSDDLQKQWRMDVMLHGRDASLTEVKFIHQHAAAQPNDSQEFVQLNIYGRGNNAYRWAGEADVYEAQDYFLRIGAQIHNREAIDTRKTVLRGFSMGGAGAWHLGLHNPSHWCSVSPGAGFTTTHGYVKGLPAPLPPHQEACLRIYDAVNYAENAFNVPIVAYGGEKDPQLQAARNIEERLRPLGLPFTMLVGPDTEHKYHPDSLQKIMSLQAGHAEKGKQEWPSEVRFVTYTPQYSECHWVHLANQERPYEKSVIRAEQQPHGFRVTTENVRAFSLVLPSKGARRQSVVVDLDGAQVNVPIHRTLRGDGLIVLEKHQGTWRASNPLILRNDLRRGHNKNPFICGPIDRAFMQSFLCVRGTGKPWHEASRAYAEADFKRFQAEWDKHFRGELRVRYDQDLTLEELNDNHLILFGDPGANSVMRLVLNRLPLAWTEKELRFADQSFDAATHVPVMIYPSPFAPDRYVVLNSGHTFHAKEFEGSNALLYPRLGDYAILKMKGDANDPLAMDVVTAGLFDVNWQVGKAKD